MDIATIIESAKQEILDKGEFPPMLIIERDNKEVDQHRFTEFPGVAFENQKLLFAVGREYGILHTRQQPTALCFVNEMWFHSWQPDCLPSENPDCKEMLVIRTLTIADDKTFSQQMHAYEMVRGNDTLELLPHDMADGSVQSKLLICVLAGISTAKLSDRAFGKMVQG